MQKLSKQEEVRACRREASAHLQEDGTAAIQEQVDVVEGGVEGLGVRGGQRGRLVAVDVHQIACAAVLLRRHRHLRAHAATCRHMPATEV